MLFSKVLLFLLPFTLKERGELLRYSLNTYLLLLQDREKYITKSYLNNV